MFDSALHSAGSQLSGPRAPHIPDPYGSMERIVDQSQGDIQRKLDRNRPPRLADQASDRVRQIEDYRIKRPVLSL